MQNSFLKNKHYFIHFSIYESSAPIKHIDFSSDKEFLDWNLQK